MASFLIGRPGGLWLLGVLSGLSVACWGAVGVPDPLAAAVTWGLPTNGVKAGVLIEHNQTLGQPGRIWFNCCLLVEDATNLFRCWWPTSADYVQLQLWRADGEAVATSPQALRRHKRVPERLHAKFVREPLYPHPPKGFRGGFIGGRSPHVFCGFHLEDYFEGLPGGRYRLQVVIPVFVLVAGRPAEFRRTVLPPVLVEFEWPRATGRADAQIQHLRLRSGGQPIMVRLSEGWLWPVLGSMAAVVSGSIALYLRRRGKRRTEAELGVKRS